MEAVVVGAGIGNDDETDDFEYLWLDYNFFANETHSRGSSHSCWWYH